IDGADLGVRIVARPLDPVQLFPLHVKERVGTIIELAGMVPVAVADDQLGYVLGLDAERGQLVLDRCPVLAAGHLQVVLLLPPGIVEDDIFATLDHAHVHRKVHRVDVVLWVIAALNEGAVRHEGAEGHVHEAAAFHYPDRVLWYRVGSPGCPRAKGHSYHNQSEPRYQRKPSYSRHRPLFHFFSPLVQSYTVYRGSQTLLPLQA